MQSSMQTGSKCAVCLPARRRTPETMFLQRGIFSYDNNHLHQVCSFCFGRGRLHQPSACGGLPDESIYIDVPGGHHGKRRGQGEYPSRHLQAEQSGHCRECLYPGQLRPETPLSRRRRGAPERRRQGAGSGPVCPAARRTGLHHDHGRCRLPGRQRRPAPQCGQAGQPRRGYPRHGRFPQPVRGRGPGPAGLAGHLRRGAATR